MANIIRLGGHVKPTIKMTTTSLYLSLPNYDGNHWSGSVSGTIPESGLATIAMSGSNNGYRTCSLGANGEQVQVTKGQVWTLSGSQNDRSDTSCQCTLTIAYASYE